MFLLPVFSECLRSFSLGRAVRRFLVLTRNSVRTSWHKVHHEFWRSTGVIRIRLRDARKYCLAISEEDGARAPIQTWYINLDKRADRDVQVRKELEAIGVGFFRRFSAIENEDGLLGCGLSHLQVIRESLGSNFPLLVCEDDVEFLVSGRRYREIIDAFLEDPSLDVLLLGNNQKIRPIARSPLLAVTTSSQTTSCYVAKPRALPSLERAFSRSVRLLRNGVPPSRAALDKVWLREQRRELLFAVPVVRVARQRASWSDIQKAEVNYQV